MIADEFADTAIVRRLGYDQTLFRGINAFTNFAFGFTGVGVLVSISSLYGYGLITGGPVVMFWGFIITFLMTMLAAHSLAEICSAFPSAGSVYHWSGQVVPAQHAPLWSYICGWFNFLGNTAGDAAFAYTFALFLNAAIFVSGKESYNDTAVAGVAVGVLFCWTILNIFRIDKVGWVNDVAAFIQTASIFVLVIVLFSVPSNLNSATVVFTKYNNETGFHSSSYVVVIGILLSLYSFCGYEASAHMAEETHGSAVSAPKGIIYTCAASGIGGLIYLLALLFATTDIDAVVNGTTSVAAIDVFLVACGSKWATAAAWLLVVNMFFAGVSSVAVSGRITFALMRDNAFPYSSFFSEVHPTLQSPIYGIFFIFAIDLLILSLAFSPNGLIAFFAILSLTTIGLQVSYGIPIFLKLIYQPVDFPKTQISLGVASNVVGAVSCTWLFGSALILFFPTEYPVTLANMNWACVITAIFFVFGSLNWIFNSQYHFVGPQRMRTKGSSDNVTEDTPLMR